MHLFSIRHGGWENDIIRMCIMHSAHCAWYMTETALKSWSNLTGVCLCIFSQLTTHVITAFWGHNPASSSTSFPVSFLRIISSMRIPHSSLIAASPSPSSTQNRFPSRVRPPGQTSTLPTPLPPPRSNLLQNIFARLLARLAILLWLPQELWDLKTDLGSALVLKSRIQWR